MSDTPRTDTECLKAMDEGFTVLPEFADFARELERENASLSELVTNLRWALEFVDEKTRLEGNRGAKVEQVLALALAKCRSLTPLTELPKCEMERTVCGL